MVDDSYAYLDVKLHWKTVGKIMKAYRKMETAEGRSDSDILADLPLSYILNKLMDNRSW